MTRFFACVADGPDADAAQASGFDGVVGPAPAVVRPGLALAWLVAAADGTRRLILEGEGGRGLQVFAGRCPALADLVALGGDAQGVLVTSPNRLLDACALADLAALTAAAHARGLLVALAGGLEPPDVPRVLALRPDMLLFGRALRTDGAFDPVRAAAILALRPAIAALDRPSPAPGRDRIFVRGLVRSMAIGAYASERGRLQRVGVSIEADLDVLGRETRGLGDVVSYDLLADTVDRLIAGRHVDLVETLAEDIAAVLLRIPRIGTVRVRIEKLDLGAEAFGVEIERSRSSAGGESARPAGP